MSVEVKIVRGISICREKVCVDIPDNEVRKVAKIIGKYVEKLEEERERVEEELAFEVPEEEEEE